MDKSLQSWSPRTQPLKYDSLLQSIGCQGTTGNKIYGSLPFVQVCIAEHDAGNPIFNASPIVSYCIGPRVTGAPLPWFTRWVAWVATAGIRAAKGIIITPPADSLGETSSLWPNTKPVTLSLGFTPQGRMAIAIEKDGLIQIKWFADDSGTIALYSFPGYSPALFENALLVHGDQSPDLVCYYLRTEISHTLFARFSRDNFTVEYAVNSNLPAVLSSLISSTAIDGKHVLYARDQSGHDVTLFSNQYAALFSGDENDLSIEIVAGSYQNTAVILALSPDHGKLSIAIVTGAYTNVIKEPDSILSGDKGALSIGIDSGEYQ